MTTNLLLIALFVFCMIIMSMNHGKKKKRILFFGDTINDMDKKPGGYISWIMQAIADEGLEDKYQVSQSLLPGRNIYDLYMSIDDNMQLRDAQVVVLHVGLHDVWDKYLKGTGTELTTFNHVLHSVINKLQHLHLKIVVLIPSPQLKPGFSEIMLSDFADYAAALKEVCDYFRLPYIKLDNIFDRVAVMEDDTYPHDANRTVGKYVWKILKDVK